METEKLLTELLSFNVKKDLAKYPKRVMDWAEYNSLSVINDVTEWVKPDWSDVLNSDEVRSTFMIESQKLSQLNYAVKAWLVHYLRRENRVMENDPEPASMAQSIRSLIDALKSVNFNMEDFIREEAYRLISDNDYLFDLLMEVYMPIMDPAKFFVYDWSGEDQDFLDHQDNLTWVEGEELLDTDILLHMITGVRCEQDFWNMMGTGVGDIQSLYSYYMSQDDNSVNNRYDNCAYGMLRNIILSYEREHEYSSLYHTSYGKKAHDQAYYILVNDYLNLYDDYFFCDSNWRMIQRAWYSGIDSIVDYMKGCEEAQKYIARLQAFDGLRDGDMFTLEAAGKTVKGYVNNMGNDGFSVTFCTPSFLSTRIINSESKQSFVETIGGVYYTNEAACRAADMMYCEMMFKYNLDEYSSSIKDC